MDSSSNEADEAVKYLYRLDELDEILAINQNLLIEIQNAEGNKGSSNVNGGNKTLRYFYGTLCDYYKWFSSGATGKSNANKENIINYEVNMSRFKVTLKDVKLANKEAIQKLGAKGIVEIDNQLKIILGPQAKNFKKYIDDLK